MALDCEEFYMDEGGDLGTTVGVIPGIAASLYGGWSLVNYTTDKLNLSGLSEVAANIVGTAVTLPISIPITVTISSGLFALIGFSIGGYIDHLTGRI